MQIYGLFESDTGELRYVGKTATRMGLTATPEAKKNMSEAQKKAWIKRRENKNKNKEI